MTGNRSPNIRAIVEFIWKQEEHVCLTTSLEIGLSAQGFSLSSLSLLDQFERIRRTTAKQITKKISECDNRGIRPRFRFSPTDEDELVFQPDSISESFREKAIKTIAAMPWRHFERLCCLVLQIAGVPKCSVMRGTKEGGVDLFGVLDPSNSLHPAVWRGSQFRVFCQVKKGRVGEPVVRQFSGDLQDLYADKGRAFKLLPAKLKKLKGVVLGGVFSAQGFSKDADDYAKAHGFFVVGPERLVEVLLTSGRNLPGFVTHGNLTVDETRLREYLISDANF
jgi:hypothetical protein